ncbi:SIR2 family protein [Paenibacillus sp. GCM10012306]|uniref:SIR2 family protein n=1 Tax=Paenibacillus sp. GCM10012306 TaxID=3317342 RepID=UPI00361EE5AC
MRLTKEQFLDFYSQQTLADEASLFLGSGVSATTGYPSWKSLLQPCARQLGIEITDSTDLYLLAQYYANTFGESALKKIVNDNINILNHESSLIDELLNLNFSTVWTTNYDTVLEKNLHKRNIQSNSVNNDKDLANISRNNRVNIYKLNGDVSNLDRIVISKNDLDSYNSTHELLLTFFKKELVSNTFLFLGYSFSDTLVLSCLNTINKCLGNSANYHYAIMKDEKNTNFNYFIEDLEKRYKIRVLLIDNYDDLPIVLNELNKTIKKKNIFFSGTFEMLPSKEDLFAYELCDKLSEGLLLNKYYIYTGYGRKMGNYLAGTSIQHLLNHNMKIEKHLLMRPFLSSMSPAEQYAHREMLITNCHVAIFMFGQSPYQDGYVNSRGVKEEFEIAKKHKKIIIPIGVTSYSAAEIWEEVKNNITLYPYLERYIDILKTENNPSCITKVILQILEEVCL